MDLASSTFYAKSKVNPHRLKKEADLRDLIEQIVLAYPGYGYRRVMHHLRREGCPVNHKRVLRVMKASDLLCRLSRRWRKTTDSDHGLPIYPNLLRDILVTAPNQVWVADLTYIRIETGFVYLAVILDAFSRTVIGYALSTRLDTGLAMEALEMVLEGRKPLPGCIHHSDRGVQYASADYVQALKDHGFGISMSRKGNPYDNAMAESFFKTLKQEEVYLTEYQTIHDVRDRLPRFLEDVYNRKRLHSSLGYLPPSEFEFNWNLEHNACREGRTLLTQSVQS
jgi:putative transposase